MTAIDRRTARPHRVWSALCGALLVAVGGLTWSLWRHSPSEPPRQLTVGRLTSLPGIEGEPTLSPDGKSVIYAREGDLWLLRVGGNNPVNLTADSPEIDFAPAFSPDGALVAFNSFRASGGIFVMGATGENVRRVSTRGFRPSWTPDGKELVFAGNGAEVGYHGANSERLEAVEVASGKIRPICTCNAQGPAVSPHGLSVAFWGLAPRAALRDLWLVPLAGLAADAQPVRLTDDPAHDWSPQWAPDGRTLYFVSDRGGSPNLWRLPIDESSGGVRSAAEPATLPAAYVRTVSLAADGRTFAYPAWSATTEFATRPFDLRLESPIGPEGAALRIGYPIGGFDSGTFSPDGRSLVVRSGDDIVVLKTDGSALRTLVAAGGHKQQAPAWSPREETIAFVTDRAGKYEIWGIAPDGSNLRPLVVGADPLFFPIWSPDGSGLLAFENVGGEGGSRTLVHRTGDPPERFERLPVLPGGDAYSADIWSRSGAELIGHGDNGSLWRWSFSERGYRKVLDLAPDAGVGVLAELADRSLLLYSQSSRAFRIERLDPASGARIVIFDDNVASAALAPDGKTLWLERVREEADLWIARFEDSTR